MRSDSLVEVVGAGPAGLTAAITAARAGARVVVYERAQQVGTRFHGDFQGIENWSTEEDALDAIAGLGVASTFPHAPFRAQTGYAPDGSVHVCRSAQPLYYVVRRGPGEGTLDRALRAQAEELGVEIRFGHAVAEPPPGSIVGRGPRRGDVIAGGYVFETDMADGAHVALGTQVAPGGYAYLLVHDGHATLSVCLFERFRELRSFVARAVEIFTRRAGMTMRRERAFGGAGTLAMPRSAVHGEPLVAGEAAGFQDPLWGFGIRNAMLSGHLAARALVAGDRDGYDAAWRARIAPAMRGAAVMRFFYATLADSGYSWLLGWLSRQREPRRALHAIYRPAWWKSAAFPLVGRRLLRPRAPA
jgi:flavin-dependent dehydrogenase